MRLLKYQSPHPSAPNDCSAVIRDGARDVTLEGFRRALALAELPPGIPQACLMADGERLCLVREGEAVFAMVDRCPHRDFNLSSGDMVAPGVIECPWHGAQFDCRTGDVLQGPATDALTLYAVRIENGEVLIGPHRSST